MSTVAPIQRALLPTGASAATIFGNTGLIAAGNATRAQKLAQSTSDDFGQHGHFAGWPSAALDAWPWCPLRASA